MFRVEVLALLDGGRRLTDDEVTDVIAGVVDELDAVAISPSVGTSRVEDDDVEMTVAIEVDEREEWEALAQGIAAVRAAFLAAGIGTTGLTSRRLRSHVITLRAA